MIINKLDTANIDIAKSDKNGPEIKRIGSNIKKRFNILFKLKELLPIFELFKTFFKFAYIVFNTRFSNSINYFVW